MATITFSFILESLTTTCFLLEMLMMRWRPGEEWERWENSLRLMSEGNIVRISSSRLVLAQSPRVRAEKGTEWYAGGEEGSEGGEEVPTWSDTSCLYPCDVITSGIITDCLLWSKVLRKVCVSSSDLFFLSLLKRIKDKSSIRWFILLLSLSLVCRHGTDGPGVEMGVWGHQCDTSVTPVWHQSHQVTTSPLPSHCSAAKDWEAVGLDIDFNGA